MPHSQSQDLFNRLCAGTDDSASSVDSLLKYEAPRCVTGKLALPAETTVGDPNAQPSKKAVPASASDESEASKKPKKKKKKPRSKPVLEPEGTSSGESECSSEEIPTTKRSKQKAAKRPANKMEPKGAARGCEDPKKVKKTIDRESEAAEEVKNKKRKKQSTADKKPVASKTMTEERSSEVASSGSKNSKKDYSKKLQSSQRLLGESQNFGLSKKKHREVVIMTMAKAMLNLLD